MPLRKRKPTSAGRRFQTVSDFSDVTTDTPEKTLLAPLPKTADALRRVLDPTYSPEPA